MFISGKVIYHCFLAVVILGLGCPVQKLGESQQGIKSQQVFHEFPPGTIQCRAGDYLIVKTTRSSWKVSQVEELFFMSRLGTMTYSGGLSVVEEISIADSATPPKWHKIQLLLNEFQKEFATREEAIRAVESGSLGDFIRGLCRGVEEFPKETCEVYTKRR